MQLNTVKVAKTAKLAAPFVKGLKQFGKELSKNSNWIFALLGMVGLAGTTWQMIDATIKAVKLCEEKEIKGVKEIVRTVWKLYIPGIGFIILTTVSIAGHTRLNRALSKKLVTATGLYAASQADLKAFKDKAKEMLGERKAEKIEQEVTQDKVKKLVPPDEKDIVDTGHGNQLFQLSLTGGYLRACPEWVELQIKTFNDELDDSVDGVAYVHRLLELFHQPECDVGNLYYDKYDMLQKGYKRVEADITTCRWDEYKGKPEVVSVISLTPWPTGF